MIAKIYLATVWIYKCVLHPGSNTSKLTQNTTPMILCDTLLGVVRDGLKVNTIVLVKWTFWGTNANKNSPKFLNDPNWPSKVFYQTFWMRAFNHPTPKRTIVFSPSALVKKLDRGALKRSQLQAEIQTTDQYVSKEGKKRFKGNSNLKGTQFHSSVW